MFGILKSSSSLVKELEGLDWSQASDYAASILHKLGKRGDLHLDHNSVTTLAMENGELQHFSILQSYGCRFDIMHPTSNDIAPLWTAVRCGNRQAIEFLLNQNVSVSYQRNGSKFTPLRMLPQNYNYRELWVLCEELISRGASIGNWKGSMHIPLLNNILQGASIDTIKVLLDLGADPFITDHCERNCLDNLGISSLTKQWVTDPDHVTLHAFNKTTVSYEAFISYIVDAIELFHFKGLDFHTKNKSNNFYGSFYAEVLAIKERKWGYRQAHHYD